MDKPKKAQTFGLRLEPELLDRINAIEEKTGLSRSAIARASIIATCEAFEKDGKLVFPLMMVSANVTLAKSLKEAQDQLDIDLSDM